MKYNFSAQFLKIQNPDTNFGEAWESLCFDLLKAEYKTSSFRRLAPPDKGIDILMTNEIINAIQCKSDERGNNGSLSSESSINSLKSAFTIKDVLNWEKYIFATNANFTGNATIKILESADELKMDKSKITFWEPNFWFDLCDKHVDIVKNRFDYRVLFTEEEVIDAFKKARYFDKYISEFKEKIKNSEFNFKIKIHRTPLEIEFPFSKELTVENCVDVIEKLIGISLEWNNFNDLGTSANPKISLTINRYPQEFNKKIGELNYTEEDYLEFWIKIIWRDEKKDKGIDYSNYGFLNCNISYLSLNLDTNFETINKDIIKRESISYKDREKITLSREELIIQKEIWDKINRI